MSCGRALGNYLTDVLIETGSGMGGGIAYGLSFGYKRIYSVEIDPRRVEYCKARFNSHPEVQIDCGESIAWLKKLLPSLECKCTFLLDAHIMNLDELHSKEVCPILVELEMILRHSKMLNIRHNILIDDIKLFDGRTESFFNYSKDDIRAVVNRISPELSITYHRKFISII